MKAAATTVALCFILATGASAVTHYYSMTAHEFRPEASGHTYTSLPWRLVSTKAGAYWFGAPVHLPDGAEVTEFKAWVFDANATQTIQVPFARTPLNVMHNVQEYLSNLTSSGSLGLQELVDDDIDYAIIDNSMYKYFVGVFLTAGDTTTMLVGVRIAYEERTSGPKKQPQDTQSQITSQNSPNPVSTMTAITYSIAQSGSVVIKIYNSSGQLIRSIPEGHRSSGTHRIVWEATDDRGDRVSSGTYFYVIENGEYASARKMIIVE